MPGARQEGLEVVPGSTPGTLSITAKISVSRETEGRKIIEERSSRQGRDHKRVLPIAWDADVNAARTSLDAGVLTIIVPKKSGEPWGKETSPTKA